MSTSPRIVTLELRAAVRCRACSVLTPLPGLRAHVSCRNCAEPIDYAAKAADARVGGLRYPFGGWGDALVDAAFLRKIGEDCVDARDSNGSPVQLKRVAAPACPQCDADLPFPEPAAEWVTCPACAEAVPVRWPDAETALWDDRITCVVGDAAGRGRTIDQTSSGGETIGCGGCGAPVAFGDPKDRRRTRTCTFCGAANYLPDAAWVVLHPQPLWHRSHLVYALDPTQTARILAATTGLDWYSVLDRTERSKLAAAAAHVADEARAAVVAAAATGAARPDDVERLAVDGALDDAQAAVIDAHLDVAARERLGTNAAAALVRVWARSESSGSRRLAAAHPAVDGALLATLAVDGDAGVRARVAARKDTPKALLARLRKDPDAGVVAAVKQNPHYEAGFFERLFG